MAKQTETCSSYLAAPPARKSNIETQADIRSKPIDTH